MKLFDAGRPKYGKILEMLLDTLQVENVLRVSYTVGTAGSVQVDVETKTTGIYSFSYDYGNFEFSKDKWTGKSKEIIADELLTTAIRFASLREYYVWKAMELFNF